MKQIMTVFQFTFNDAIKKKSFVISTIIILVLIVIASLIPKGVDLFTGGETSKEDRTGATYYYVDDGNVLPSGQATLEATFPDAKIQKIEAGKLDQYKKDIRDNQPENSIILVSREGDKPTIKIFTSSFLKGVNPTVAGDALSKSYTVEILAEAGVSQERIGQAMEPLAVETESVSPVTVTSYIVSILLTFLIFFSIYYYGYAVAMSVATEKASRVMETLVVSAKPSRILIGKILAMGAIGLIQLALLVTVGVLCYKLFIPKGFMIAGMSLDISGFNVATILILLVYFLFGYLLYAVMNSVSGALVSKIEDLSSAMMPVMVIALGSFYMGYISVAMGGKNTLATVATYIPFSSPFVIPSRVLNGELTTMNIVISLLILIAAIVIITMISVRIYSVSVLRYGNRLSMFKVLREKR